MKIRSRRLIKAGAWLGDKLFRLLFATCRIEVIEESPLLAPYHKQTPEKYLYCIWHDQLLYPTFCGLSYNIAALVSGHADGSILADCLELRNFKSIRGSSSKGGTEAVRELLGPFKNYHVTITPDGPRGPRREIKTGIGFLGSKSSRGIVPVVGLAKREWRVKGSWTDMAIPMPFTTILLKAGKPVYLDRKAKRDQIDQALKQMEQSMAEIEIELAKQLGRAPSFSVETTEPIASDDQTRQAA